MKFNRMYHSIRLLLCRTPRKRAAYLKTHNILGSMGENCKWGPWLVPLYPELIRVGNNVHVHKTAKIVTHDMLNAYLKTRNPQMDFGHRERLGCVELQDNVYIAMNTTVMPDVRINKDCIVTAGSVVTSDIPENSIATGNPAKVVGRFDMYVAFRRMGKGQNVPFKNQELPREIAEDKWAKFEKKRANGDKK
jgi:acetyltransferase-like isoleucine patch superfamily enzyme